MNPIPKRNLSFVRFVRFVVKSLRLRFPQSTTKGDGIFVKPTNEAQIACTPLGFDDLKFVRFRGLKPTAPGLCRFATEDGPGLLLSRRRRTLLDRVRSNSGTGL